MLDALSKCLSTDIFEPGELKVVIWYKHVVYLGL